MRAPDPAGERDRPLATGSRSPSTASRVRLAGDTIVSALTPAGRRVFSRSFKYHRPRGELCGCGQCAARWSTSTAPRASGRAASRCARGCAGRRTRTRGRRWSSTCMRATDRRRRPVHPARLLLQDLHPPAAAVAAVREGPAQRRRARPAARAAGRAPSGAPSTAGATATCWSSAAGIAGLRAALARRRARAPTSSSATRTSSRAARCSPRAARARARWPPQRAHGGSRDPLARPRARVLRRAGAGLAGRHAAPGPRRAPRRRDRRDPAAAGLPRQRPARGDARRRRAPARRAVRRPARASTRGRDGRRPRARSRARAARRRRPRSPPSPTCAPTSGELGAPRSQAAGIRLLRRRTTVVRALGAGRLRRGPRRASTPSGRATRQPSEIAVRPPRRLRRARARRRRCCCRPAPGRATTRAPRRFLADDLPAGVHAAGAVAGHEDADAAALSGHAAGARGGRRARPRRRGASAR